jgi:hypothetical protein
MKTSKHNPHQKFRPRALQAPDTYSDNCNASNLPSPGGFGSLWRRCAALSLALFTLLTVSWHAEAGTWAALANPPPAGLNNSLLLSDGTVICGDGGQNWYRLTPDIHGSYVNGTWTQIASTTYTRLFYSSQVLTNGNVYVAGGEDGTGTAHAELYDTLANSWSVISQPSGANYSDADSKMLPGGNVLQGTTGHAVYIYNTAQNVIVTGPSAIGTQDEACWVRLPNDNVLTIDTGSKNSEHYVPSLNEWVADGNLPVAVYGFGAELGAAFVLPNGKVFQLGATPHTAIYTPGSSLTAAGSWVAGADIPNSLGQVDAPAAMMANGKILCDVGPTNGFNGPISFFEYDYSANSFAQVNGPTGTTYNDAPFASSMLDLPDGNILFIGGQGTKSLYVYTPGGTPLAAGKPVINSITQNGDGSFHLTGTGLNGISGGAAYGDDWQMDTSYPLVRLTAGNGNVYYARTFNWNNTTIMTGSKVVTTEFSVPASVPDGSYSLVVIANGNSSSSVSFTVGNLANGTYKIINLNSGLAVDVKGLNTTNGSPVQQYAYNGGANQQWTVTSLGGSTYKIIGVQSGLALDVVGSGTANGTGIDIFNYNGAANQQWILTATSGGNYRLTPGNATGSALDVQHSGTTNSIPLQIWNYNGGNSQQWSFQSP